MEMVEYEHDRQLSTNDILAIQQRDLPLLVFSRSMYSGFADAIARRGQIPNTQKNPWNHFFLMVTPSFAASQDLIFKERPIERYLRGDHILKFWTCSRWTQESKAEFIRVIKEQLKKPWFLLGYDWLQIIGFALRFKRIQLPWFRICCDWSQYVSIMDPNFESATRHYGSMSPPQLNLVFAQLFYEVWGRYYPDF